MCIFINRPYPCGHCYECLSKLRNDWSIRLQAEYDFSKVAYHAILTYDDEHLPRSKNGLATVSKKDFILFNKRLRHHFDKPIKFFAVSEYGPTTLRPHYHVIYFGVPKYDDVKQFGDYLVSDKLRNIIQSSWQKGEVRFRSSYVQSKAQLHYILKDLYNWYDPKDLFYVFTKLSRDHSKARALATFKRNTFDPFIQCGKDDDRVKNFRLMSKNLGISFLDTLPKFDDPKYDYVMSWNSTYIQDRFAENFKYEFLNRQRELYATFDFDHKGRIKLPPDIAGIRDFVELEQTVFDKKTRKSTSKTVRYAIPKYYRQKCFSRGVRELLNRNHCVDRYDSVQAYLERYGDYDATHDIPMYLEIARRDWRIHASRHKDLITDKLAKNEYF